MGKKRAFVEDKQKFKKSPYARGKGEGDLGGKREQHGQATDIAEGQRRGSGEERSSGKKGSYLQSFNREEKTRKPGKKNGSAGL